MQLVRYEVKAIIDQLNYQIFKYKIYGSGTYTHNDVTMNKI